ncbi:hypothetical protein CASFOL_016269 [Castilleja foliolosa]|uniref:F-box domain-containing protein n=1 Tax=Castilleja foliolosa TaxID=1961234 RepID=A0ABD3DG39_9LAMI
MKNWDNKWPIRSTKTTLIPDDSRISKLPDHILHKILSSVDIKQAVQTSVLSKRWRRLCYTLPNLNFDFYTLLKKSDMDYHTLAWSGDHPDFMSHFERFVLQFLSQRDHTSALDKFCLWTCRETTDSKFVEKCIEYAIDHGVRHIHLDAKCRPTPFRFPDHLFASRTLRVLKIKQHTNNSIVIPKPLLMPNLKTLYLDNFEFKDDTCNLYSFPTEPFSGFPNLEELTMFNCQVSAGDLIIRSKKLRFLEISDQYRKGEMKIEEVSTPGLISFRYEGEVSLVCKNMDLPCLEEVYYDYYPYLVNKMPANLVRMLQQLGNAKFVTTTFQTLEYGSCIGASSCEGKPGPVSVYEVFKGDNETTSLYESDNGDGAADSDELLDKGLCLWGFTGGQFLIESFS